jgi:magnesium-transporting ATPase (P-type)
MKELDPKQEVFTNEEVEKDLTLIGITGVEDELQVQVVDCLRDFREAGINLWMLTGDKGETAREIGTSCGLFERDNFPVFMVEDEEVNVEEKLREISSIAENQKTHYGFMVGGS